MTSATVQAVGWLPNGHDGLWVAVRGRVTETPQEWKVMDLEVLAASFVPAPLEWLLKHGEPAALEEVRMRLEPPSPPDRYKWRLEDALVAVFRAIHYRATNGEESEVAVLRRMYAEVKARATLALVAEVRRLRAALDGLVKINSQDFPLRDDGTLDLPACEATLMPEYIAAYRAALVALGREKP